MTADIEAAEAGWLRYQEQSALLAEKAREIESAGGILRGIRSFMLRRRSEDYRRSARLLGGQLNRQLTILKEHFSDTSGPID